jgi:hypothetical protein
LGGEYIAPLSFYAQRTWIVGDFAMLARAWRLARLTVLSLVALSIAVVASGLVYRTYRHYKIARATAIDLSATGLAISPSSVGISAAPAEPSAGRDR